MAKPVNWFPGHMARTLRIMGERMKLVDLVIETCDARIPVSSRNPEFDPVIGNKPRILVLGKRDLADPAVTEEWVRWYAAKGLYPIASDNTNRKEADRVRQASLNLCRDVIERAQARGRSQRPLRAMVVGIPNTGKSTLINTLAGRSVAQTEDRPGVTRAPQWVRTKAGLELMDMPGALWPNLGAYRQKLHLAVTGAIRDEVLDIEEIAYGALEVLARRYPDQLAERFGSYDAGMPLPELFEFLARKRGCIRSGGKADMRRFSVMLLDELRGGRVGSLSLETPEEDGDRRSGES